MRLGVRVGLGALLIILAAGWWLSRPLPLAADVIPVHQADVVNGERLFHAGGCASCHAADSASGDGPPRLTGGHELVSPFGVFVAPNISPHPDAGIGRWSDLDFLNAMLRGLSPAGRHYYPAFPYTSYTRMSVTDLLDLKAFLDILPPESTIPEPHRLRFPYNLQRGLGLWKRVYLDPTPVFSVDAADPEKLRGRYLVEAVGHCGECHTSRNRLGALRRDEWLQGAPSLEGEGIVPDISADGLSGWSASDIAYYLESGFDPDFDVVGGAMVAVQENMARLPPEDRAAIAAYLKSSGQP